MGEGTAFDAIVRGLDHPMYVVTAAPGMTSTAAWSASRRSAASRRPGSSPASPSRTTPLSSRRPPTASSCNPLRDDDHDLAVHFGSLTGDTVDKFAGCDWTPGPDAAPAIAGLDWFAGRIIARHDVGDHVAYVLDVTEEGTATRADRPALGY